MKFHYNIILLLLITLVLLQSCKEDTPVETPGGNTQTPSAPVLLSPGNQSTIQTLTPALDWEDYQSASAYRLQVSLDANFAGIIILDTSGLTVSNFTIQQVSLTTNVYYYWRVNASIPSGVSPWSAVWKFNIILNPPPPPILLLPPNGSTNQSYTPLMDWEDAATAQFYRIQISASPGFIFNLLDSSRIPVSQIQVPIFTLVTNTQYFWRVNASNSGGASTSQWSSVWNFTTIYGPTPNSISGTVTFVDTNFANSNGYYAACAFNFWPPEPGTTPYQMDTLDIEYIGNTYLAHYKIKRLYNGIYRIAVLFENPENSISDIMGIYGCDTVHVNYSPCPYNPPGVVILNNIGIEDINFLTWADTSKKIF